MASAVYVFVALVTFVCALMLFRAHARVGFRLLLWSALCFSGLTIANALVYVDLVLVPATDLYILRLAVAALAMAVLVFGLVWESDQS